MTMGIVLEPSTPVAVAYLPNELVEKVLGFCSSQALSNVCLVDRRFSDNAYPLLYRTVSQTNLKRATNFLSTVYLYDRPASLVRSLTLSFHGVRIEEPFGKGDVIRRLLKLGSRRRAISLGRVLKDLATLLSAALPKLTELSHLLLFVHTADSMQKFAARLLGTCTFQLVTFMTTLEFDAEMAAFIRTQERLQVLHFSFGDLASPFIGSGPLPGICSTLETLGWTRLVPVGLVREFTENCPISGIHVHLDIETESIADLLDIGPSSKKITDATFTYLTDPTSKNLQEIAFQFPNIKHLVLNVRVMTEEITRELAPAFRCFENLEGITLSVYGPADRVLGMTLRRLLHQWFHECKTMHYLSLPHLGQGLAEKGWYNKVGATVGRQLIEDC
ncbi:hypothetical protein M413DRAFT_27574 [Hebeloma cylindrosporum]|uniref:F-box domain-containing protein n=1 Tax=Hebeloma cylindrosporum TaxID=76867 RepID=A0A0C3CCS8_HEBCY|nr:hypothetical protein M413DRAFT_27574 [Hebeloma cylindrosporum h7]